MASQDQSLEEARLSDFALAPPGRMTEEEFVAWCDEDTRAEWVDGEVVMMSPANQEHAILGIWLARLLGDFVERRGLGQVLYEYQVRFATQSRRRQPDLIFLSKERLHLLKTAHVEGPPDLIVEIVSPDSESRDWREKYLEYEAAGVREYWVVDPMSQHVEVYALEGQPETPQSARREYRRLKDDNGRITSSVLPNFCFCTAWLWPETRPTVEAALQQLGLSESTGR